MHTYGDDTVSTGKLVHGWQVEWSRHDQKKINANKVKNAVANMFGGNQALAFA